MRIVSLALMRGSAFRIEGQVTIERCHPARGGHRKGFTLVELLVVIFVLTLLMGLLFPSFAKAKEKARQAVCQFNLRQIGLAFEFYTMDSSGRYPCTGDPYLWMGRRWRWPLKPYVELAAQRDPTDPDNPNKSINGKRSILVCPSDETAREIWDYTSYAYSAAFYYSPEQVNSMTVTDLYSGARFSPTPQSRVEHPSLKALVGEWLTNHDPVKVGWWDWRGSRNYLFADGHVQFLSAKQIMPAVDGFPDVNLTVDGIAGADLP